MNKNEQTATMYENIPAVAELNKVPGFNPLKLLRRIISPENGEEMMQLDLRYKKLWFRLANPKGRIRLNALRITEQMAIYEAQVFLERTDENPIGSFTSSCTKEEAPGGQYIQAAQYAAMDEALSDAGFGIQFADVGMDAKGSRYGSRVPFNGVAALLCSPVITLVACHRINRYNDMRTEKGKGSRTPVFRREPCSGTTIKTWLLYQDMKWNTRRTKIFLINSKEECICPCCGSPLKYRDSRKRVHKVAGGGKEWYLIRRLRCSSDKCGKLHNELPDCICPYKHYDAGLIEDVADGVVSEVDTETEDYPCEGTMKHWRWWLWMNEKNMEGHLRLAAHRFLDLDGKFLKSRASLLEEMKERISPGWLKAAARVIYNSGGRIEPYPSAA